MILWLTDILLVSAFFFVGLTRSSHSTFNYTLESVYLVQSRCIEELPRNQYIVSAYDQKFYLSNYYTDTNYGVGDSLTFCARISHLSANTNPGEFSYAEYLKQKEVHYQFIPCSEIRKNGHSDPIYSFFSKQRDKLLNKTKVLIRDSTNKMLIDALCLGFKNDLDHDLQDLFITTGTVHLLSVSGLHTGAIYLLILFLFKRLGLSGKKTELGIIPLLWMYACLTGMSPSVVRAATILTFITIGKAFCRSYTPINSLAASAFFSLLIQPSNLYSLSFLLSYSAYAGILVIYPFLFRLPGKLPPIPSKVYACFCITIAAQLPTLPVSAYCFHTLNINGFLANLIAVPLATLLLYSASISLVLPCVIGQYTMPVSEILCKILTGFLRLFAPYSYNLKDLYPTLFTILLLYGSLISILLFIVYKKRYGLYGTILCLVFLTGHLMMINLHINSKQEIIIFHHYKQSAVLLRHKGYYSYLINTTKLPGKKCPYILQNKIKPLPPAHGIITPCICWQSPLLYWGNDTILIAGNQHPFYQSCSILIVTDNISPEKLINITTSNRYPDLLITDGSNHKQVTQKWYDFCKNHKIPFRNTFDTGYISLPLK